MAAANWPRVLVEITLPWEGGKVNHPKDPGGKTNQGVTQRTYNSYRTERGLPIRDVYLMSDSERDAIYEVGYWRAVQGDELAYGVDGATFDAGVMSGPSRGIKWLQQSCPHYKGKIDSRIGPQTIAAQKLTAPQTIVKNICAKRLGFVQGLKTYVTFGKGWMRRITDVEAKCVKLALMSTAGVPVPAAKPPLPVQVGLEQEAREADKVADAAVVHSRNAGTATTVSGSGTAVASSSGVLDNIEIVLLAGGILILAALFVYFLYKTRVNRVRAKSYREVVNS